MKDPPEMKQQAKEDDTKKEGRKDVDNGEKEEDQKVQGQRGQQEDHGKKNHHSLDTDNITVEKIGRGGPAGNANTIRPAKVKSEEGQMAATAAAVATAMSNTQSLDDDKKVSAAGQRLRMEEDQKIPSQQLQEQASQHANAIRPRQVKSEGLYTAPPKTFTTLNDNERKALRTASTGGQSAPRRFRNERNRRRRTTRQKLARRIQEGAQEESSDGDSDSVDQVDLLQLAAQRSHGIYADSASDLSLDDSKDENVKKEDNVKREEDTEGLLNENSLSEEKMRHFHLGTAAMPSAATAVAAAGPASQATRGEKDDHRISAATTNTINREDQIAKSDAMLKGMIVGNNNHDTGDIPHEGAPSNNDADQTTNNQSVGWINSPAGAPGAYQGAPGRGFRRVSLTHPHQDDSARFSVSGMQESAIIERDEHNNYNATTSMDGEYHIQEDDEASAVPPPPELLDYTSSGHVISAVRVDEDDLEIQIRDEITNNAAQAEVVDMEQETNELVKAKLDKERRVYYALISAGFVLFVGILVALILGLRHRQSEGGDDATMEVDYFATLKSIRERGKLLCGIARREDMVFYHHVYYKAGVNFAAAFVSVFARPKSCMDDETAEKLWKLTKDLPSIVQSNRSSESWGRLQHQLCCVESRRTVACSEK